jgi:glycosyltransferase involved in cell wall biosynthesis
MRLSVILPTHKPDRTRLRRTLAALRAQTLPAGQWETVLVDNASHPAVDLGAFADVWPDNGRRVPEAVPGLTRARVAGLRATAAELIVFVDDDNVLAPDYLAESIRILDRNPTLGAAGGRSLPSFDRPPPPWTEEFFGLIAVRDLGDDPQIEAGVRATSGIRVEYPRCAPIGAGLVLRRVAAQPWLERLDREGGGTLVMPDRRGDVLTSGGDNDLVFSLFRAGFGVGYFPSLALTHLIPAGRLEPAYLARLNRGIQRSWVHVLARHDACPWPSIPRSSVWLRQARAYWRTRAWVSAAHHVRWQGLCGRFEGQADLREGIGGSSR